MDLTTLFPSAPRLLAHGKQQQVGLQTMMTDRPTSKTNCKSGATPRRRPIVAPLYKSSMHGIPEQDLLHRNCADL